MHDPSTLVDLATFAAVVKAGSFTGAADALGLSKSVVSRRVSALEERYGVRLLHRTTRRMELTEIGDDVYAHAVSLLREAEEAEVAATVVNGTPRGTLRVNAPAGLLRRLAAALPVLLARHPALRLDVSASDAYRDVVGSGFDLTLRVGTQLPDASVVARRLAAVDIVVCAAPSYLARRGVPTDPYDLRDHDCLRYSLVSREQEWRFQAHDGPMAPAVDGTFASDNAAVLTAAAIAGLGVVVLPDFEAFEPLQQGRLVRVLADHPMPSRSLYAMYPHRSLVAPKVTAFADFVAEALATCPQDHGPPNAR